MGNGANKSTKGVRQENAPKLPPVMEIQQQGPLLMASKIEMSVHNSSPNASRKQTPVRTPSPTNSVKEAPVHSPSQIVSRKQTPIRSPTHSIQVRSSTKQSVSSSSRSSSRHTALVQIDNNGKRRKSDEVSLPSIHRQNTKSPSRISARTPSAVPSLSTSRARMYESPMHRKNSITPEIPRGRCAFCPHCKENTNGRCLSTPEPLWFVGRPKYETVTIDMMEYDAVAVREKTTSKNGHLPGEYDYEPQLTIEKIDEANDKRGMYCTRTLVATTEPQIVPVRTPFPDYDLLQLRENYANKINSLPPDDY